MECYSFTLVLSGFEEITEAIENALFDAGCDDALLGVHSGSPYLAFDREAESLEEAIKSAIKNVEGCGQNIQVVRVIPPGADTMETINAYLKMRRQLLLKSPDGLSPDAIRQVDDMLAGLLEKDPAVLKHVLEVISQQK